MSRLTRENCDIVVSLPMVGRINSLNASVAGSILLYESFRQRLSLEPPSQRGEGPKGGGSPLHDC